MLPTQKVFDDGSGTQQSLHKEVVNPIKILVEYYSSVERDWSQCLLVLNTQISSSESVYLSLLLVVCE
jgi:hypothetical protein